MPDLEKMDWNMVYEKYWADNMMMKLSHSLWDNCCGAQQGKWWFGRKFGGKRKNNVITDACNTAAVGLRKGEKWKVK
ncbi:MAG: hypothetical protein HQM16_08955 [Deltaproteobacteria bacterium]|nr:hypothetical protein [Deltaproteobacteria bacterium]